MRTKAQTPPRKWFPGIDNAEDLKKAYHKLALKYHPDRNPGDAAAAKSMQEINAEFDSLFEILKNTHRSTREDGPRTYEAAEPTKETAEDFRNILTELFKLRGLDIELCGRWLWIGGNTREHKDRLKELGCKWSKNKEKWSWHFPEDAAFSYKGKKAWTMDRIRLQFGSETIEQTEDRRRSRSAGSPAPALAS